jgi:hypothetical protein
MGETDRDGTHERCHSVVGMRKRRHWKTQKRVREREKEREKRERERENANAYCVSIIHV